MKTELIDIIDDTLQVKYLCDQKERKEIMNFLRRHSKESRSDRIAYMPCFLVDGMLVCIASQLDLDLKKFVYWNLFNKKRLCLNLPTASRLQKEACPCVPEKV